MSMETTGRHFVTAVLLALLAIALLLLSLRLTDHDREVREAAEGAPPEKSQIVEVMIREIESPEAPPPEVERTARAVEPVSENPAPSDPDDDGRPISIRADYRANLGFPGYVRLIERLGGAFFLFNASSRKLIAKIDPIMGTFEAIDPDHLQHLSPSSRSMRGEIAMDRLLRDARQRYGAGNYEVIVLLPLSLDQHLQENLRQEIRRQSLNPADITQVDARYVDHGNALRILSLNTSSGERIPAGFVIRLDQRF